MRQKLLSLSECERLCGRGSREVGILASQIGWATIPGGPINVPLGTALNMLIVSNAMSYGVEAGAMAPWLPGLRTEALLKLGEEVSNWSFDDSCDMQKQFLPMLYGSRDSVRARIAGPLGCCVHDATRRFRFHSQMDVECLSNTQLEVESYDRAPRFSIDAHDLADRVQAICATPLFFV